jgi:ankyrin repeat protein
MPSRYRDGPRRDRSTPLSAIPAPLSTPRSAATSTVSLLAELGHDVNLLRIGQAALQLAAFSSNHELCELLLRLGPDPNLEDYAAHAPASLGVGSARTPRRARHLEKAVEQQTVNDLGH